MSITWQNAEWALGRRVVAWAEEHIDLTNSRVQAMEEGESWMRALCNWRTGHNPSFHRVDRFMVAFDRHVSELPDNVWTVRRNAQGRFSRHKTACTFWWKTEPVRHCEACGEPIPFRRPNGMFREQHAYRRARWCSVKCQNGRVVPKPCEHCGELIPLKLPSGRSYAQNEYKGKRYCSKSCKVEAQSERAKGMGQSQRGFVHHRVAA